MKKHRFSLRLKLILLTTVLAIITYSFSGLFIYVVHDWVVQYWNVSKEWFTVFTLLKGVFWSIVLAYFSSFFITRPLERLEKTVSRVEKGYLNEEVVITRSDDEIRSLSIAFKSMIDNLQQMVQKIEDNFQTTNHSVVEVKEVVRSASHHVDEMKRAIKEISEGSLQSASAMQNTNVAIEQATILAETVGKQANRSKAESETMLQTLNESTKIVQQLTNSIETVANEQKHSLDDVLRLKDHATKAESIISMVGGLAEQTNLLALNASIEASRAGEQGQGFAVVAEEVRQLADESKEQVTQIARLITAIQEEINEVVNKITKNVEYTTKEVEIGTSTNKTMNEMSSSIVSVADEVDKISDLVKEQLEAIHQTMSQSKEVLEIAEKTSADTEKMEELMDEQIKMIEWLDELSQNLHEQADELNRDIEQFHIS